MMEIEKGRSTWIVPAIVALVVVAVAIVYNLYQTVVETAAPGVTQADGSQILPRAPDAKAKPKQSVPRGTKVERIEQVKVQGAGLNMPDGTTKPCPPVTVDMTIVRESDGARRVIASSPDGLIVGGVDIPVETAASPPEPKQWAAGISIDPIHQATGVWMERDLSRIRVGVDLNQRRNGMAFDGAEVRVRVGWTF